MAQCLNRFLWNTIITGMFAAIHFYIIFFYRLFLIFIFREFHSERFVIVENKQLKRQIKTERAKLETKQRKILNLQKQVNIFKQKYKRMQVTLRKNERKSVDRSGLDVRFI